MSNYKIIVLPGFEQYKIIKYNILADGHCLFHAIATAFYIPYETGLLNNNVITKLQIVVTMRHELSIKLSQYVNGKNGPRYYDLLSNGYITTFAESVPEYTMTYMKLQLNSCNHIGYGYIEFIGNQINKDIYIIDGNTKKLYVSDDTNLIIKKRNSIVLYYHNNHYELIGILNENNQEITHFRHTHPFIQELYKTFVKKL